MSGLTGLQEQGSSGKAGKAVNMFSIRIGVKRSLIPN